MLKKITRTQNKFGIENAFLAEKVIQSNMTEKAYYRRLERLEKEEDEAARVEGMKQK